MCALIKRTWPGNVRELLHTVRRQYIMAGEAGTLDIPAEPEQALYRRASDSGHARSIEPAPMRMEGEEIRFSIGTTFEEIEREALLKTLAHFHNNKREAARVLGVSLKTIYNKLLRYRSQGLVGQDVLTGLPEDNGRAA
jgi:DNA-binding NtrC family response regulator